MEELVKALNTIKKECEKHENCDKCPMGDDACDCFVKDSYPDGWNIIEPKTIVRVME